MLMALKREARGDTGTKEGLVMLGLQGLDTSLDYLLRVLGLQDFK